MFKKIIYITAALLVGLLPCFHESAKHFAPGLAVTCGSLFAVFLGNPFARLTGRITPPMLGVAIVLMGCGMDFFAVLAAGANGIWYTVAGIAVGIALGTWLGKLLKIERNSSCLISVGTAICGGSAIAAAAPVLQAKPHHVAIASTTVFALNMIALLIFPPIGHALNLSQSQFGLWSALAIHDTSSVVGAAVQYGPQALEVGTAVKLARALWIIPVTLYLSMFVAPAGQSDGKKRKFAMHIPWFIPGFLAAAAINSLFPGFHPAGAVLKSWSIYLMITTLFLIGSNLDRAKMHELGLRPVIQGIVLWVTLSALWGFLIANRIIAVDL